MHWIILNDSLADEPMAIGKGSLPWGNQGPSRELRDAVGRKGWVLAYMQAHGAEFPFEFRLLDGDGIVNYEGLCGDITDSVEDLAFAPLDWACAHAGCTDMEYRKRGEEKWRQL
jgi:hypothetical protein